MDMKRTRAQQVEMMNSGKWGDGVHYHMTFDAKPPGKFHRGMRVGNAVSQTKHNERLPVYILDMVDGAGADGYSFRGLILSVWLCGVMMNQPGWTAHRGRGVIGPRVQAGLWRGHPVYCDVGLDATKGALIDEHGDIFGTVTVANMPGPGGEVED